MKRASAALLLAILGTVACSKDETASGPLKNVQAIVILQRTPVPGGMGDVLQYTGYQPGGRLLKLSPPSADGTPITLCCDQFAGFEQLDIQSYDIAFDAKSIVFSGKLSGNDHYSLYVLTLNDKGEAAGAPTNLTIDPNYDMVYPNFAAGQRILFMTNKVGEGDDVKQFKDEYERGTTAQLASVTVMGTDLQFAPRNLSHRVFPSVMADGRVLITQWDHVTEDNSARIKIINPDGTNLREAFGSEGSAPCNSVFKPREVSPGRIVTLCSSRDRTVQAGKILDVQLGRMIDGVYHQSEAQSSFRDLTPLVPSGREPSSPNVGRYYDAEPLPGDLSKNGDDLFLLVSWANGPVEDEMLGAAGLFADFGIYLYDSRNQSRLPIFNTVDKWEVLPKVLAPRPAPATVEPTTPNGFSNSSALVGGLKVQVTSLSPLPDTAVGVVPIEGFSGEEGFMDFGAAESEGAIFLGTAAVLSDNSWAALIPSRVPVRLVPIDRFGVELKMESQWISVPAGGAAVCGGCHEARDTTTVIQPGVVQALATTPINLDTARPRGLQPIATPANPLLPDMAQVSYSWTKDLEPAFVSAGCVNCHDGTDKLIEGKQANKTRTYTETATMLAFTYRFDLRPIANPGDGFGYAFGEEFLSTYSPSHMGLVGVMIEPEMGIEVTGDLPISMLPENARGSLLIQKLNPCQLYPALDCSPEKRFVPNQAQHPMEFSPATLAANGNPRSFTWQELLMTTRMTYAGAQFCGMRDKGLCN